MFLNGMFISDLKKEQGNKRTMTYNGPAHAPQLLQGLERQSKPQIFQVPKDSVMGVICSVPTLSRFRELIEIANYTNRMSQDEYNSTSFVIVNRSLGDKIATELSTAINTIKSLTLDRVVTYDDLLNCDGNILKTLNPRVDMKVEVIEGIPYVDGRKIVGGKHCANGALHILE